MTLAASRTFWTAGKSKPIRMAMIASTTNSSISVKPGRRRRDGITGDPPRGRVYESSSRLLQQRGLMAGWKGRSLELVLGHLQHAHRQSQDAADAAFAEFFIGEHGGRMAAEVDSPEDHIFFAVRRRDQDLGGVAEFLEEGQQIGAGFRRTLQ